MISSKKLLNDLKKQVNPLFPALRSGDWLFQGPPANSTFLAVMAGFVLVNGPATAGSSNQSVEGNKFDC